jgi:acetaldehyde dehydrogenase (acetylating)
MGLSFHCFSGCASRSLKRRRFSARLTLNAGASTYETKDRTTLAFNTSGELASYTLKNGPVFDGKRITVWMEVAGLGDFLPRYAGNLDIMTAAALRTAEMFAEEMDAGRLVL